MFHPWAALYGLSQTPGFAIGRVLALLLDRSERAPSAKYTKPAPPALGLRFAQVEGLEPRIVAAFVTIQGILYFALVLGLVVERVQARKSTPVNNTLSVRARVVTPPGSFV